MNIYKAFHQNLDVVMKSTKKKEVNGEVILVEGKTIRFIDFIYKTDDEEEIKFLDSKIKDGSAHFVKIDMKKMEEIVKQNKKSVIQGNIGTVNATTKKPKYMNGANEIVQPVGRKQSDEETLEKDNIEESAEIFE